MDNSLVIPIIEQYCGKIDQFRSIVPLNVEKAHTATLSLSQCKL